jgi:phosphohistidine phosphatase SixA
MSVVVCRHAHRDESGHLDSRGVEQSHSLGMRLKRLGREYSCIITSTLDRAVETGGIVKGHLHIPCLADERLDEYYPNDSRGFLRILMAVWGAMEMGTSGQSAVIITHSCVVHRFSKLFGRIPWKSEFHAMPLAAFSVYEFPLERSGRGWYCETEGAFRRRQGWITKMVGMVDRMWTDAPVPGTGGAKVFKDSSEWLVERDIWAMEKWNVKSDIIMAISKIRMEDGGFLRCMRDLRPEHVGALKELDREYEDSTWVKYIMYPPFVWRLHVHIQGRDAPLPFRNAYLLGDVIRSLEMPKGSGDLPVWSYG